MDDTGTARLATGGRTFVVTPVGSPLVEHPPYRWGDHTPDLRFRAPEVQWPEEHAVEQIDEVAMTKESDVYEVAMVAYEASFYRLTSSRLRIIPQLLGLDEENPVFQMERYRNIGEDTARGTSSKTLRDRRGRLGVPSKLLEQGSYNTPINRRRPRYLLAIPFPS